MSPRSKKNGRTEMVNKIYPEPFSTHERITEDSSVFWDTLRRFHFDMGTKFMIPVIGGRELDLHVLYREATKRGGYEKVVAEKKWREVGAVFNFSPTTTSASFVLRKHYLSLLFQYEQVHLFRFQGPLRTPTDAFGVSNSRPELAIVKYSPKPIRDGPGPLIEANGTIEGKFDCGYLVSVRVGSEVLHGVLYHPKQQEKSASIVTNTTSIVPYKSDKRSRRSGRRRRKRRSGDPSYPKPNRSGYNFFFAEKHYKLKSLYPNREREFTKIIGHSWSNLSPEEKKDYENIGLKDKERYKRELREYKEKLKIKQTMEVQ